MKKLFILILTSLFCVGLFAAPKIPKSDTIDTSKYLTYLNDSGTNLYSTIAVSNKNENIYLFSINNQSYITDTYISI
ncbi:hypothetical protein, partial [Methanobrevibacter sp.]|uniref:hypothetical protein n=1 Tax=Methanobrevibacter sp. TaxID=66852 RepID=UPI00388F7E38